MDVPIDASESPADLDDEGMQFDEEFYAREYPDTLAHQNSLTSHFFEIGWVEGRNPNQHFDVVSYLAKYPDVAASGQNPFVHFLRQGSYERRAVRPSLSPSVCSSVLFGHPVHDWVGALKRDVDPDFYRQHCSTPLPADVDPVAHFAYRGWRDGLSPRSDLSFGNLLETYPRAAGLFVNPLLALVEARAGRYSEEFHPARASAFLAVHHMRTSGSDLKLVGHEFDAEFYAEEYPDVLLSRELLLAHFCEIGWKEGRNPNPYFDVVTYLLEHPDVAASPTNPFIHYLLRGKREGRRAVSSVTPSVRSGLLFGYAVSDWVTALESDVDVEYYRGQLPEDLSHEINPIAHFAYRGWRQGLNPSATLSTASLLETYPQAGELLVNPLLGHIEGQRGRYIGVARALRPVVPTHPQPEPSQLLFGEAEAGLALVQTEFDAEYYLTHQRDVSAAGMDPLNHYFYTGWREGRDPSAQFSTSFYLASYPDVSSAGINPLWHFIAIGRAEGRVAIDPSKAEGAWASSDKDRIALVRTEFSERYYLAQNADVAAVDVEPVLHYYYEGWREGRDPSAQFSTSFYLASYPDVSSAGINPLWHFIAIGRAEGRVAIDPRKSQGVRDSSDEDRIALVRTEFSERYYLAQNADVAAAGVDPVLHYYYEGWREGRNPNKNFQTLYYLETNEDIRAAGMNPFWHYLVAGRAENRAAYRPGGFRRQIIEAVQEPEVRTRNYRIPEAEPIAEHMLAELLDAALADRAGVAVALSHDCYVRVVGGTQIVIADEQRRFGERNYAYIHLSPRRALLTLSPYNAEFEIQIVLDGEFVGITSLAVMTGMLCDRLQSDTRACFLIIHSVLGFEVSQICALHKAMAPDHAVFWLHDYTSICEGLYLTRNDLEFCHAPPPDSMVCRVCIYGGNRARHLESMRRLFEYCDFEVLSPSQFTLDLWRTKSAIPAVSAEVQPHWKLLHEPRAHECTSNYAEPTEHVRIGFVGLPVAAKGWHYFSALVDEHAGDPRYSFVHFAARGVTSMPECEFVVCEVTADDRWAATRLLCEHAVDFVAMLSPWPETFSFVAHEALAAGCQVLCLADSGNVAASVRSLGRGMVFDEFAQLREFVGSSHIFEAAKQGRQNRVTFRIADTGTTAMVARFFDHELLL